jgi:hypothetical protein
MRVVSKYKGAIERFEKIMQYEDDEFFCYRVFQFERAEMFEEGGLWVADYAIDVAWGSDKWFYDSDNPDEKIIIGYNKKTYYRKDGTSYVADDWDSPIYGTSHYTSVTHLCGVLDIGVELWTTEPGCGFEEHAMADSLGRMKYETAEYREECTDDGEIVGEKHGFKDFGDWLSASEIYGGNAE